MSRLPIFLAIGVLLGAVIVVMVDQTTEVDTGPAQLVVHPSMTCSFTWTDADGDTLGSGCEVGS